MKVKVTIDESKSHYEFEMIADDAKTVIKKIKAKRKEITKVFHYVMISAKIEVRSTLSGELLMDGVMKYDVFSGRGNIEVRERRMCAAC